MEYLDNLSKDELLKLAKKEYILLSLTFSREEIIRELEKKGYKRNDQKEIENNYEKENDHEVVNSNYEQNIVSKENEHKESSTNIDEEDFKILSSYEIDDLIKSGLEIEEIKYLVENKELDDDIIKTRLTERDIINSKYISGEEKIEIKEENDIYFDRDPLPSNYLVNEVVLMPKNNKSMYVYWEVKKDTVDKLREENNTYDVIVIKIYKNGNEYREITRHDYIGGHFINDIEANQEYDVKIGLKDENGNFYEIASSSSAISSRDAISENEEVIWYNSEGNSVESYYNKEYLMNINTDSLIEEITYKVIKKPGSSETMTITETKIKNLGSSSLN